MGKRRKSVGEARERAAFGPLMSKKQWQAGEARHNASGDMAIARRLTFSVLTKSRGELEAIAHSEEGASAILEMVDAAQKFITQTEVVIGMSRASLARLMDVLSDIDDRN